MLQREQLHHLEAQHEQGSGGIQSGPHLLSQLEQGAASARNNALLNSGFGGIQRILHPQLLLLQLCLSLSSHLHTVLPRVEQCAL